MIPPTSPSDKLAPMSVPSITARAASPPAIGKLQDPSKGLCLPKASFASTRPSLLPPVGAPPTKSQSTARVVAPPPLHLLPVQRTVGTTIASQLPNSPTNLIMAQSDRAMFSRQQRDSNKMEGCRSRTSSESAVTTTESVRGRVLSPIPGSPPISPSSGSHHVDSSSSTPATIQRAEGSATGLKKLASLSRESKKGHLGEDSANRLPELKKVGSNLDSTRSTVSTRHATQGGPQLGNGYAMFCEPWKREKVIGQGQFGTVFLARNLRTGERMAVKQVMIKSVEMLEQMIAEVTLNCRASFRNQNVVTCMGWSVTNNSVDPREEETFGMDIQTLDGLDKMKAVNQNFNIFMEYVERGSISSLLEKNGPLPEPATRNYMRQLLLGLRSLHAAGIAHRDIKCQNLLLTSENVLKVADFGSAKKVVNQTVGSTSSIQGSIPWMSPEVIRQEVGKGKDEAAKLTGWKFADVWSVGCTMIEMLTGRPPWNNYSNPAAMMFAIAQSKEPPKLPDESVIHPDGLDFLRKCCNVDPGSRPSVAKLIYHPYMRVENVDVNGLYSPKAGSSQHGGRMSLSSTLSDDDDDDLNKSKNNNFATEDRKTATRKKSNVNATRVESQVT